MFMFKLFIIIFSLLSASVGLSAQGIPSNSFKLYVSGEMAENTEFTQNMAFLGKIPSYSIVNLYINSPGGEIFVLYKYESIIAKKHLFVVAHVDHLAASAAAMMVCAAQQRIIADQALLMFHMPYRLINPMDINSAHLPPTRAVIAKTRALWAKCRDLVPSKIESAIVTEHFEYYLPGYLANSMKMR